MPQQRVLIIKDDRDIAELLTLHLHDLNLEALAVPDGMQGLAEALSGKYSLLIIDLMLPGLPGNEIIARVRARDKLTPILVLTLKSELGDKVQSLNTGADDYLTKPFSVVELSARVKALLRRAASSNPAHDSSAPPEEIHFPGLDINIPKRRVVSSGRSLELTPTQFDLLVFLAQRPGRAFSRAELLNYVWGYEHEGYEPTVDTHINRLRSQVESDPRKPRYILTVWGVGYRFAESTELTASRKEGK